MKKILLVTAFFVVGVFAGSVQAQSVPFPTYQECMDNYDGKLEFCHATSSEDNPYSRVDVSCNALYGRNGNAGHLSENGTPLSGHEDDVMLDGNGLCPDEEAESTPTPTPTPTPSPTSDTEVDPTPTPTPTPSSSSDSGTGGTSSSGSGGGMTMSLNDENLDCQDGEFTASVKLDSYGTAVQGTLVRFFFNGQAKESTSASDGYARVNFSIANGQLKSTADGFPDQTREIKAPENCPTTSVATRSKVLGATTLADTGMLDVTQAFFIFSGVLMSSISLYALKSEK